MKPLHVDKTEKVRMLWTLPPDEIYKVVTENVGLRTTGKCIKQKTAKYMDTGCVIGSSKDTISRQTEYCNIKRKEWES